MPHFSVSQHLILYKADGEKERNGVKLLGRNMRISNKKAET